MSTIFQQSLQAQIVAARAYEAGYGEAANWLSCQGRSEASDVSFAKALAHRRAAEIMEAEAAKEEGGEG